MNIERNAIAGLKWTGAARFIGQLSTWAVTLIVIRILAPQDYGLMAISAVIIGLSSSVAELGLGSSIVQAPSLATQDLARVAGLAVALNLAIALLVVLLAPLAAQLYGDPRLTGVIQASSLQFLPVALGTVPQALSSRKMRFKWLAAVELASGLAASLTTLGLALNGAGVWSLVLGGLAGSGVRAMLLVRDSWITPSFDFAGIRRHMAFGGAVTTARLAWQIVNQSDVLIAGRFLTQEAVGVYSVSMHMATLPMQKLMGIVSQVAFPTVARLQNDPARLRQQLVFALGMLNFVAVPTMWGLSAVAPEFVALLFGPKWINAVFPLQVASLIVPVRMCSGVISTATLGVGAATLDLRNTIVNLVVLPLAFVIGVRWGVDGLAIGGAVGLTVVLGLTLPRMCKVLGLDPLQVARTGTAPMAAGLALYGAVVLARWLWPDADLPLRLTLLILAGGLAYLATITLIDPRVWRDTKRLIAALRA
jgi:O-antigen/teichoic acid export membrane protein